MKAVISGKYPLQIDFEAPTFLGWYIITEKVEGIHNDNNRVKHDSAMENSTGKFSFTAQRVVDPRPGRDG